jgi:hypothetical protein
MSRIFDALREVEREAQAAKKALAKVREMPLDRVNSPAQTASEDATEKRLEKEKTLQALGSQLCSLEARLLASRAALETLLASAARLQESLRAELEKSQRKMEALRAEMLKASSDAVRAQLLSEMATFSDGLVDRARKRLEEKTALAIEELAKSAEAWLAALGSEFEKEIAARALSARRPHFRRS